ncbi:HNH endonuclease [Micropruina sonneratiae]|uniref:HNH endonuclease n=1 Tax=Micropruina sonneratiae TaxID=2986940 RepID=UPI002226C221|nr:DUF222 domain-containing protein [Micropruina sp. KQZ13P-5]MCW3159124.1 DUF222 domain-containing protein [Micropruina sp. KQZ13P-5]
MDALDTLRDPGGIAGAAALVERIGELERAKNAAAAEQARLALELLSVRKAEAAAQHRPVKGVARSVAAEVALARRESPSRGARLLSLAWALEAELPATMKLFAAGEISEYRASLVARETACLSRGDRALVDAALSGRLAGLANGQVVAQARRLGYELDPQSVVERNARAEADRRVSLRPAPEGMALLSALLPVTQGVGVFAALSREAARARAAGDDRGKGQLMADTLVERVIGHSQASHVPIEVQLVITDGALLGTSDVPARVSGYGPIPAAMGRRLAGAAAACDQGWLRRLYAAPGTGRLVAMETKARRFSKGMRRFLALRDVVCRTPWCGAPIRHADHVLPVHAGGVTSIHNGQGLCERCNQVKESPGWHARPGEFGESGGADAGAGAGAGAAAGGSVTIRTPSGHYYASMPPPLPHENAADESTPSPDNDHDANDSRLDTVLRRLPFPLDLSWRVA